MIPKHQNISIRRIVLRAELNKVGECVRVYHGLFADLCVQRLKTTLFYAIALVGSALDDLILPLRGAAGLNNHADVVTQCGIHHLFEVGCCHAALALQVGPAHIDHNGDGSGAGSVRIFCAGAAIHRTIRFMCLVDLLGARRGCNLSGCGAIGAEQGTQRIRNRAGGTRRARIGRSIGVRATERAVRRRVATQNII